MLNIAVNDAQERLEKTPKGGIAPAIATGSYEVDDSVIAGRTQPHQCFTRYFTNVLHL